MPRLVSRFFKLPPWLQRQSQGVANCYTCDRLVSLATPTCIHCGARQPGLWGYSRALRHLHHQQGFLALVTWGCVALYGLTLLVNLRGVRTELPFEILVPDLESLLMFGATGEIPLFKMGRWWTVLTAAWLHGHVFHLGFNLGWIRYLTPLVTEVYGIARMVVLYTGSAITAALLSSVVAHYGTALPPLLQGAYVSVGASGSLFGLFGALVAYGRQTQRKALQDTIALYAGLGFILGFALGSVDNWGHLG
ncbi:MAG: rhomboid family intramembrane serine protease, partial [Prochlorothrix sp.]